MLVRDDSEYAFHFTNATGTYLGTAHIMSDKRWVVNYGPVDTEDPNATYRYVKKGNNLTDLLNGIDPAWMNY